MVRAYILIETVAGHSRDLVGLLERQTGIQDVARVTGPYDVVALLEARDVDELSNILGREIHSAAGVVRTTTCVCLH